MKTILFFLSLVIVLLGCKPQKEISITSLNDQSVVEPVAESTNLKIDETTVVVKEENVLAVEELEPIMPNENFFIIMGSFKILNNAKKFQNQLLNEGFESQILQNENGLFRVSILSFKEINEARNKVYFIRKNYPKYDDVWLLKKLVA